MRRACRARQSGDIPRGTRRDEGRFGSGYQGGGDGSDDNRPCNHSQVGRGEEGPAREGKGHRRREGRRPASARFRKTSTRASRRSPGTSSSRSSRRAASWPFSTRTSPKIGSASLSAGESPAAGDGQSSQGVSARQRAHRRAFRALHSFHCGDGTHGVEGAQHRSPRAWHGAPWIAELPLERRLRLGGFRELGERVPADGGLRHADRVPVPTRIGGVARSRRRAKRAPPSTPPAAHASRAFLYAYSLGIALAGLFVASFVLHLWGSLPGGSD